MQGARQRRPWPAGRQVGRRQVGTLALAHGVDIRMRIGVVGPGCIPRAGSLGSAAKKPNRKVTAFILWLREEAEKTPQFGTKAD